MGVRLIAQQFLLFDISPLNELRVKNNKLVSPWALPHGKVCQRGSNFDEGRKDPNTTIGHQRHASQTPLKLLLR